MTKHKKIIIVGVLTISILVGLYVQATFVGPKQRIENTKAEINELISNGEIQNGDLIFQTSLSDQSKAIQLATNSKYSHCGLLFKEGKDVYVLEAVQPVKQTPLDQWIARGKDEKYVIKRLKNASEVLTPSALDKMNEVADNFIGKNYDKTFEWSDDKIYCSELIWKIYQRATGIEIGQLEKLSDLDLTNEAVKSIMKKRYGNKIPLNETVISPSSIFESELLITVVSN
jgi:uncharacterized protein YycO